MEDAVNIEKKLNKQAFRMAVAVGIATFLGFSVIFPVVFLIKDWGGWYITLLSIGSIIMSGQVFLGINISFLLAIVIYFLIKFLIKEEFSKKQFIRIITFSCIIAILIGFLLFLPTLTFIKHAMFNKEKIWKIDTNGDRKTDKWVHDNINEEAIEIDYDTNLDGKPDIWEYYKDRKVYKKEIDTDFDGKPDKIEKY